MLRLGFEAKPKVKYGAPLAPNACGLGRRVAVDWTWASLLPRAALESAWLCGPRYLHSYSSIAHALLPQFLCFPETLLLLSNLTCALPASSPWRQNKQTTGRSLCFRQVRLQPSSLQLAVPWCSTTRPWTRCVQCLLPASTSRERRWLGPRLALAWLGQPLKSQSS